MQQTTSTLSSNFELMTTDWESIAVVPEMAPKILPSCHDRNVHHEFTDAINPKLQYVQGS
jgi:hypothetical protein